MKREYRTAAAFAPGADRPGAWRAVALRPAVVALAVLAFAALVLPAACGGSGAAGGSEAAAPSGAAAARAGHAEGPLVIFLGDSLTAGYGLPESAAFPSLLGERLRGEGIPVRIVNAGVSGDTSGGGLDRLGWLLQQRPEILVVGLGANDALRGQSIEDLERNLDAIVGRAKAAGARVLLLGMKIPPSYGFGYAGGFSEVYSRVAKRHDVPLVPFLLDGVGGRPGLNLDDGLHPNEEGQKVLAENVLPYLRKILRRL